MTSPEQLRAAIAEARERLDEQRMAARAHARRQALRRQIRWVVFIVALVIAVPLDGLALRMWPAKTIWGEILRSLVFR